MVHIKENVAHWLLIATLANLNKQQCIFGRGRKNRYRVGKSASSLSESQGTYWQYNITSGRYWHRRRNVTAGVLSQHFQFGSEIYCTLSFSKNELYCKGHYYQIYIHIHNYIRNLNSQNILSKFPSLVSLNRSWQRKMKAAEAEDKSIQTWQI